MLFIGICHRLQYLKKLNYLGKNIFIFIKILPMFFFSVSYIEISHLSMILKYVIGICQIDLSTFGVFFDIEEPLLLDFVESDRLCFLDLIDFMQWVRIPENIWRMLSFVLWFIFSWVTSLVMTVAGVWIF